jgi:hypothetical protein
MTQHNTNRKLIALLSAFLLPFYLFCQEPFIPSFNPATNSVSVTVNPCDACILGGKEFIPYCECVKNVPQNCKHLLTQPNSMAYYNWCLHEYGKKCAQNFPKPKKEIIGYNYGFGMNLNAIPGNTPFKTVVINPFNTDVTGSNLTIPDWVLSTEQKQKMLLGVPYNICVNFHILIFFNDGTTCHYNKWVCYNKKIKLKI